MKPVFMHGDVFKKGSRNSTTFKMELFATMGNGRFYNQWIGIFACCCSISTIFIGKIKTRWKWPCLEGGIRYNFWFCRHVFTFFSKTSITFCFTNIVWFWKLITIMKTGIIVDFIFQGFANRNNHHHMFWKMLLIKCRKNIWRSSFLKK